MNWGDIAIAVSGFTIIVMVLSDVFQSIIVPHYRPKGTRLSPLLISGILWQPLRQFIKAREMKQKAEADLSLFAPAAIMCLLACWLTLMTTGFALLLYAERANIKPQLQSIEEALYFAATSVLTIGFGDVVACSALSRLTVIAAAMAGLVLLAISVSFMFAIQSHFHNREVSSQIISSRHGHSKNGAVLYLRLLDDNSAAGCLELCERWVTDIYQSHSAYPILLYFRSRSSRASWLVQLCVALDAAAIAIAMNNSRHMALFNSIYDNGSRAVDVFATYLTLHPRIKNVTQEPALFQSLFKNLGASDIEQTAAYFSVLRQRYFPALSSLSDFFLIELPPLVSADAQILLQARSGELSFRPEQTAALPRQEAESYQLKPQTLPVYAPEPWQVEMNSRKGPERVPRPGMTTGFEFPNGSENNQNP
ncbi:MAG TPA: potassium channel family protein [Candidatus Obscuribacter sp.]|nr:potassium channel family protein [Candidatus Obscuribacter sp.]